MIGAETRDRIMMMPRPLRKPRATRCLYACTTALALLAPAFSQAGDIVFSGGDGDWFDPTNWTSGTLPAATDRAIVDGPVQATIFGQQALVETLAVGRGADGALLIRDPLQSMNATVAEAAAATAAITLSGTLGQWSNAGEIVVGVGGSGTLTIMESATARAGSMVLGRMAGANGSLALKGEGSRLDVTGTLTTGFSGHGTVSIEAGAWLASGGADFATGAGSSAVLSVDGNGSRLASSTLIFGGAGNATGTLTAGGVIAIGGNATLGLDTSGRGDLTLRGAGSTMTVAGRMTIAENGSGTLTMLEAAQLSSASAMIGAAHGATGTVSLSGLDTLWTVSGELSLGTGTLQAGTSAGLATGSASIGALAGDAASASLQGDGTHWTNRGLLTIGDKGTGTLSIGTGASVASAGAVTGLAAGSSGNVIIDGNGSALSVSGNFDIGRFGQGSATVSGGGTLTASTITLAAQAGSSGTLNIGADESRLAAGAGAVNAASIRFGEGNGTLVLNHGEAGYTLASSLSGTGTVKVLRGVTVLTGNNSHDGQTTIASGATLAIGNGGASGTLGHGDVVNDGSLVFNRSGESVFSGDVSGTGALEKQGSGTLALSGNSTYSGATTVAEGRLDVDGSLASAVSVASGATLGGSGRVGTTDLSAGATLAAEGLSINGDLSLAAGSTLNARLGAGGVETVHVSGATTLSGADIALGYESGAMLANHYALIEAGSVSGATGALSVSGLSSRFLVTEGVDTGSLDLDLAYDGSAVALSGGAQDVHDILASAFNGGTALSGSLSAALASDGGELQSRMGSLTGESGASAGLMAGLAMQSFLTSSLAASKDESGAPFWLRPQGGMTRFGGDAASGIAKATIGSGGLEGGARFDIGNSWAAGIGLSAGQSRYSADAIEATANGTFAQAGVSATGRFANGLQLSVAAAAGFMAVQTDRAPGAGDRVEGDFNARMAGVDAEAGWRIDIGDLALTPFAGASFVYYSQPGYRERAVAGNGNPALTYSQADRWSTTVRMGMEAAWEAGSAETPLRLHTRLAYLHHFAGGGGLNARFNALPGSSYALSSLAQDGGALQAGAGASLALGPAASLRFDLAGEWGNGYHDFSAGLGLDFQW